ncbi:MAG: hypothetical protein ACM3OO_07380, partial [Planctomycetaceae bacterium]
MTERWRKKLEGIDQVGPSDDVYRRARSRSGSAEGEPPIPFPRTRTRVMTGIAAFAVFALALSLFVVPALRLGSSGPAGTTTGSIHPLWPMQTAADVADWQARADAGDRSATWATDPKSVAERFGVDVLGWSDTWVERADAGTCYSDTGQELDPCSMASGTSVGWFSWAPTADPSSSQPGELSYLEWPCDPTRNCNLSLPTVTVTLYQPADVGAGRVWAVLAAASTMLRLDTAPGATLQQGDSVTLDPSEPSAQAVLGIRGGSDACSFASSSSSPTDGSPGTMPQYALDISLPSAGTDGCGSIEAGYVYGAVARGAGAGAGPADPFKERVPGLQAIVAVPVSFLLPEAAGDVATPTATASTPTRWATYSDPLGWTIDVPAAWRTLTFAGPPDVPGYAHGASFFSGPPITTPGGSFSARPADGDLMVKIWHDERDASIADDSTFPLSIDDVHKSEVWTMPFRADGESFRLMLAGPWSELSSEQERILTHIVSSIRFKPWLDGEWRNGYTALIDRYGEVGDETMKWFQASQGAWAYMSWTKPGRAVYGYVEPCHGATFSVAKAEFAGAVMTCADGREERWDANGQPFAQNDAGYRAPLRSFPAIRSWEGYLLV